MGEAVQRIVGNQRSLRGSWSQRELTAGGVRVGSALSDGGEPSGEQHVILLSYTHGVVHFWSQSFYLQITAPLWSWECETCYCWSNKNARRRKFRSHDGRCVEVQVVWGGHLFSLTDRITALESVGVAYFVPVFKKCVYKWTNVIYKWTYFQLKINRCFTHNLPEKVWSLSERRCDLYLKGGVACV